MKNKVLSIIGLSLFAGFLPSCSGGPQESQIMDSFSISADQSLIDLIDGVATCKLSISEDSVLQNHNYKNIKWKVSDSDKCSITKGSGSSYQDQVWNCSISEIGEYTISASIEDLESTNSLTITVNRNSQTVAQNLEDVLNRSGGLTLGYSYDIGITANDVNKYQLSGVDDVLKLDEDGKLEVIGIDNDRVKLLKDGETVADTYFSVGHSILVTNIKNELIESNIISSQSSKVTNEMLKNVHELTLSGELINDSDCVAGLKYLSELKEIDLSNNGLSDVSWLSSCTKLEKIDLSNNSIKNFNQIVDNQELTYLDVSNNIVNDISKLKFMKKISYLDLSNNDIEDISDLSTSYGLKSLFINDNALTVFSDKLSGLENLKELGIGNCNIPFTEIISLKYLQNLTYLDVSNTDPDLSYIGGMTNLKTLVLRECSLSQKNIASLNSLTELEELDISNNDLLLSHFSGKIDGSKLSNLKTLRIGENGFDTIPDLSSFESLKVLDLTNSYNLESLQSITNLNITDLIIDNCQFLSSSSFNDEISAFQALKRLSCQQAFSFIVKDNYDYLMGLIENEELEVRFISDEYVTSKTVSNYKSSVLFGMSELLRLATQEEDGSYTLTSISSSKEIVLSLANDTSTAATQALTVNIGKTLAKLSIFGNKYKAYSITFNIQDRKESSFTISVYDFIDKVNGASSVISAQDGSRLIIESHGECSFEQSGYKEKRDGDGRRPDPTINAYNVSVYNLDKTGKKLTIKGGSGESCNKAPNGYGNNYGTHGYRGGDGAIAIKANVCKLCTGNIIVKGGSGGNGGAGGESKCGGTTAWDKGVNGGDGGNGGNGIEYSEKYYSKYTNNISGGNGGKGGDGGSWNGEFKLGCSNGDSGSDGYQGAAVVNK